MFVRELSRSLHVILSLISCVSQINCESCVESKTSQKLRNFYSSRENFISITNVSCSINYFDVTSINRLTFNVIYSSESLHTLDLSSNRISEISNGTFEMFSALQILKLRDNFLRNVREHYIGELKDLSVLDLSSNLIDSIDTNAFAKLPNLLSLNIRDNCLINIPLYLPIRALHSLNLSHNRIDGFPQLSGISTISNLDLSHNSLIDLSTHFATKITSLNIAGNQLKDPNQLLSFINLIELDLANIDIDYEKLAFRHFAALSKLNLTSTNLTSLEPFRHIDGSRFTELYLAHNPLSLDFNALAKFSLNLVHLEFQQNFCYEFDNYRDIKRNFRHLKTVAIYYNYYAKCECLRWHDIEFANENIDFTTDWSVCGESSGRHLAAASWSFLAIFVIIVKCFLF